MEFKGEAQVLMHFDLKKKKLEEIEELLSNKLDIGLGVNKLAQLERIIFEVSEVRGVSPEEVLAIIELDKIALQGKGGLFKRVKKALFDIRYPSSPGDIASRIMPVKISSQDVPVQSWEGKLRPERIFIEKGVSRHYWTKSFLDKFPRAEKVYVKEFSEAVACLSGKNGLEKFNMRTENLFVVDQKTPFIKRCPCSLGCSRCGYMILNVGFGCPLDCAYCFLQTYSNFPGLVFPANLERAFTALKKFDDTLDRAIRIGTGEFADSLALEKYTGYAEKLIEFFRGLRFLKLELKTKVSDIDRILKLKPHKNVVLSWSVNTPGMAENYELGAPSIPERIEAAEKAARSGFSVGFHFDPIIVSDNWEKEYLDVVDSIFASEAISRSIAWISLGTLRYTAGLKQIAERRFPQMEAFYRGELLEKRDGKIRYPSEQRRRIYDAMYNRIKGHSSSVWVYLCMEPSHIWDRTGLDESLAKYHGERG